MKRVHTPEFEDAPWCPTWLRDAITRLLRVLCLGLGVDAVLARILGEALSETDERRLVDLGSGAGGIMPEVLGRLREARGGLERVSLTLTDRYPNQRAVEELEERGLDGLTYLSRPLDASRLGDAPSGFKTMVNCFHHLRPSEARAVLRSAHDTRSSLLIFELADNALPFWLWVAALPLGLLSTATMALVMTPFVRPLTLRQLAFTYLVPVVPLVYAWDGQASYPRMYGARDLSELTAGLEDGYRWRTGRGETPGGRALGFYLLGMATPGSRTGTGEAGA